jgi:homospermidine synthase
MDEAFTKYVEVKGKVILIGFGCVGQAVLPLMFRHLQIEPAQFLIVTDTDDAHSVAEEYGVKLVVAKLCRENYQQVLNTYVKQGDFIINLSVDVSSLDLLKLCQEKGLLYLDTCTEPWEGVYTNHRLPAASRSNYAMREEVVSLKGKKGPTAVLTHGANPGLVSHLLKQALCQMAAYLGETDCAPKSALEWASLAEHLGIKVIHVAECDTQTSGRRKQMGEFVNTWSTAGFIAEGSQPAELGWGSHERHWPDDACEHEYGSKCAIYLERPGATIKVRTWNPASGPAQGFLITHAESISIANFLTKSEAQNVSYRPTVHYAYVPCPDAILSIHELTGNNLRQPESQRVLLNEIDGGIDALGVLLMGNEKGAYWYGSQLSIHDARKLAPYNNATSMQVAAGVLSGVVWALEHPNEGVVEPEELDHQYILNIARPYLGKLGGIYIDWTPLQNREQLFSETLDHEDPWQFINFRVS